MKSFREKIVNAFAWNSINVFFKQGLNLAINITLARLLLPSDFGVIGMLSIFIELSLRLQGAGLGEALIRKKNITQEEYNFVFFYGLTIGLCCYLFFYFLAPVIADFYSEPRLIWITRLITLNLIIIPLTGINRIQLVKELSFYKITVIEISASLLSGLVGILMAYLNCGVWSLAAKNVSLYFISMILFIIFIRKRPTFSFNKEKSIHLFSFGSKLMVANFLQTAFKNIYNVIIGKQYTASDLGFYMQGIKLQQIPSNAINTIIKTVSFPVFANIREDKEKYKRTFRKTMRLLTFINFTLLISFSVVADPLIPLLLSEKWIKTIPFFQMLVVIGLLEPIKSLFINILKVEGRGGLLIKYIIFTKIFYLIGILISIRINIYALVLSQILATFFELIVFSNVGKYIGYNLRNFLNDVLPNFIMAALVGGIIFLFNNLTLFNDILTLILDFIIGLLSFCLISQITNNSSFAEIKQEIFERIRP